MTTTNRQERETQNGDMQNGDTPKQDSPMTIDKVLKKKGYVVISTAGQSMMPMLRNRKDAVEIHTTDRELKKYDVALFLRENQYVLHRIIKVLPNGYILRGDNSRQKDFVTKEQISGVLVAFQRNGKHHNVKEPLYFVYSRLTVWFHFPKMLVQRVKGKLKRTLLCK